jgi:hypothetical protein
MLIGKVCSGICEVYCVLNTELTHDYFCGLAKVSFYRRTISVQTVIKL